MRKAILVLMLVATPVSAEMLMPIISVYDGDTIETRVTLPTPLDGVKVRILGIDTPEMPAASYAETGKLSRAKCVQEAELAIKARDALRELAEGATFMVVTNYRYGTYAKRFLADVSVNGVDVKTFMIEKGYAVPMGAKRTEGWCD